VDVANACNTNCVTCWHHSPLLEKPPPREWTGMRMALEAFEKLAVRLDAAGVRELIVSGSGEPFTHPRIYDMIALVKGRTKLSLTLITNLLLADPGRLADLGVDDLLVNVSAATRESYEDFHPSLRGTGSWEELVGKLSLLCRRGVRPKLVNVLTRRNVGEVPDMVALGGRLGVKRVNFKAPSLEGGTEPLRLSPAQQDDLLTELVPRALALAREEGINTNLAVCASQFESDEPGVFPIEQVGCYAGWFYSRVFVDGTVRYCCSDSIVVDSLEGGASFEDVWLSERYDAMREYLRRGNFFTDCRRCGKYHQNYKIRMLLDEGKECRLWR